MAPTSSAIVPAFGQTSVRERTDPTPAHLVIARLKNGREVTYPLPGRAPFLRFRFPGTRTPVVLCLWHATGWVGEQEALLGAGEAADCDACAIEAEAIVESEAVA